MHAEMRPVTFIVSLIIMNPGADRTQIEGTPNLAFVRGWMEISFSVIFERYEKSLLRYKGSGIVSICRITHDRVYGLRFKFASTAPNQALNIYEIIIHFQQFPDCRNSTVHTRIPFDLNCHRNKSNFYHLLCLEATCPPRAFECVLLRYYFRP